MAPEVSHLFTVVVCTYNPRLEILQSALNAIVEQPDSHGKIKEIIVYDNGSKSAVRLKPLPNSLPIHVIRDDVPNLARARAKSLEYVRTPWIIWIDDDVLVEDGFLTSAQSIIREHSHIGIFSGAVYPVFESSPPAQACAYLEEFAIRFPRKAIWSNSQTCREAIPYGAAMVCRSDSAKKWGEAILLNRRPSLGRVAENRAGSEDIDLAWSVCEEGFSMGVFPHLRAAHHIDPSRFSPNKLKELIFQKSVSIRQRNAAWSHCLERPWTPPPPSPFRDEVWRVRDAGLEKGGLLFEDEIQKPIPPLSENDDISLCVIIATNRPDILKWERLMRALVRQSLPPTFWRLIVVENGSFTEPSLDYELKASYFHLPDAHLYRARQYGWHSCAEDIVVFLDDDCVPAPDYLEMAVRIAKAFPSIGAWGGSYESSSDQPSSLPLNWINPILNRKVEKASISKELKVTSATPYGLGLCIRREVLSMVDHRLRCWPHLTHLGRQRNKHFSHEDLDMVMTAIALGFHSAVFPQLKCLHLRDLSAWSQETLLKYWEDWATSATIFHAIWGQEIEAENRPLFKSPNALKSLLKTKEADFIQQVQERLHMGIASGMRILASSPSSDNL